MTPEEWIGIYKGLRMPLLAIILIGITWYVFRPRNKGRLEDARYTMLDDDLEPDLSKKFREAENGHSS